MTLFMPIVLIVLGIAAIRFFPEISRVLAVLFRFVSGSLYAARPIIFTILGIGLFLWAGSVYTVIRVGDYANSGISIWIVVILLPIFLVALSMKSPGPIANGIRVISGGAVVVAGCLLAFGLFMPEVKQSVGDLSGAKKQEAVASVNKETLKTKLAVAVGTITTIKNDHVAVFDDNLKVLDYFPVGTPVMLLNGGKTINTLSPEPLVLVMLRHNGHFTDGNKVFVALRDLQL
jgi:hypothetical protein